MSGDDTARFIYLSLLVGVIGGYAILANRRQIGQTMRQLMLWGLIFLGVIAGYGLWQDMSGDLLGNQSGGLAEGQIVVPRNFDGHYYLTLDLDGVPVEFVVDTGATDIVLSQEDAARVGIDVSQLLFLGTAETANGTVRTARATIRTMTLNDIEDRNVRVSVNEGELFGSLLGMAYLQRFDSIEIKSGRLILMR